MINKMEKKNDHISIDQLNRDFPFKIPDGYFEQLPANVMSRIEAQGKTPKEFLILRFIKPAIGLAASFLIILGLIYFTLKVRPSMDLKSNQSASIIDDEEFVLSYPLNEHAIFEALENNLPDDTLDNDQLETVLLASVSEYDLIDLTN
jgi:hypothetical protein